MMSIMMDAHKQRDVATADVAGACLHASLDEFTLPKWKEHQPTSWVTFPRSTRNLWHAKMARHLCLLKALHGCVKSALLWHELFTGTLAEMGFELNPHDTCAANKLVDGKQCTIHWCIDDNDTSHVDPQVVTDVVEKIEERFGKMTLPRGKKHDAFQQQGKKEQESGAMMKLTLKKQCHNNTGVLRLFLCVSLFQFQHICIQDQSPRRHQNGGHHDS
jgi:hypothetical protein